MIFIYLLFPIVPLVLASLLMTVIMRYTNIAKNKDRGNIFIGIVSILFIVGINVFLQWKNKSSFSEDAIADYLANNQSSFSTNDKLFSNYIFWSSGISRKCKLKGPLYVIIFAVISFVFLCCFITLQSVHI